MRLLRLGIFAVVVGAGTAFVACGDQGGSSDDTRGDAGGAGPSADGSSGGTGDGSQPGPGDGGPDGASLPLGDGGPVVAVSLQSAEWGLQLLEQADGKIVVVSGHRDHDSAAAIRFDTHGALDPTFGDHGRVLVMRPFAYNGVLSPAGAVVIGGSNGLTRVGAGGTLDRGFVTANTYVDGVGIQPDGLVIGASWNAGNGAFRTQRFTATGALDPAFGDGGVVETSFGNGSTVAKAVVVQPDQKIAIAGQYEAYPKWQIGLARYTAAGAIDGTFGDAGIVSTTFPEHVAGVRMVRQPGGELVALGTVMDASFAPIGFAVARFAADGSPDATFATAGQVLVPAGGAGRATGLGLRADGRIVVGTEHAIYQLTAAGLPDTAFGTAGSVTLDLPQKATQNAILVGSDDSIWGTGAASPTGDFEGTLAAWHYTGAGALDTAFATGGELLVPFYATRDELRALTTLPDGKLLAAGFGGRAALVARYATNGALDPSFGDGGIVFGSDTYMGAVAGADGSIYAVTGFDVEHLTASGARDPSFAFSVSSGDSWFATTAVALGADGHPVVTGYGGGTHSETLTIGRCNSTGAPDPTFGGPQGHWVAPAPGDRGYAVAIAADGSVVVGGGSDNGLGDYLKQNLFLAHVSAGGAADAAFGTGGILRLDMTPAAYEAALALAIQPDGKILAAGATGTAVYDGFYYDFDARETHRLLLARFLPSGALDTGFGTGGLVTGDAYVGEGRSVSVLGDGRIVVAGRRVLTPGAKTEMVAWRFDAAGALDPTFGAGGLYAAPFADDAASFGHVALPDGTLFLAGFANGGVTGHDLALLRVP